jgi:hypothetical protein
MSTYTRRKPRMVLKGRSPKQRGAAARWGKGRYGGVVRTAETLPSSSWWTGRTREELDAMAAHERTRLSYSSFGRTLGSPVIEG